MTFRRPISVLLLCIMVMTTMSLRTHVQASEGQDVNLGNVKRFLKDSHNYFVTENGNTIWAGALTLAWQQLRDSIIGEDIIGDTDSDIVQKIIDNYNTCPFNRQALNEDDYYIKAGYGQSTVDAINSEVRQKFPNKTTADLDVNIGETDIISYAYLAKNFKYPVEFQTVDEFQFKDDTVKGFRASSQSQRDQVKSIYYKNSQQFLIRILTEKENEGVYLLRTAYKSAKVQDILNQVISWENQPSRSLYYDESFYMPVIDLDQSREVSQLKGLQIKNQGFEDYKIMKAFEALKLKMDEKGVTVQNEGGIIMTGSAMNAPQPNRYILDDTFWIVLKQVGKFPYLCAKINQPVQKQQM